MWQNLLHAIIGCCQPRRMITGTVIQPRRMITGTVILAEKNLMDFNDFTAAVLNCLHELDGKKISLQLISAVNTAGPENEMRGKVGDPAYLEHRHTGDSEHKVTFEWDDAIGVPGAIQINNKHHSPFYLKTITLDNVPGEGKLHFVCNSWVYPAHYTKDRIFFTNKAYLPSDTPVPLRWYREKELVLLRGNGEGSGELQEHDRVYDYALYNDLGNPDRDPKYYRTTLGGSSKYPYPRRGRTGRAASDKYPDTERRLPLHEIRHIYVPRDENFGHLKTSDVQAELLKSVVQFIKPEVESISDDTPTEFDSFEDVYRIYEGKIPLPKDFSKKIGKYIPLDWMKKNVPSEDGEEFHKFPTPEVIQGITGTVDKVTWRTDEEFAREMIAGVNPVNICVLKAFPPESTLDKILYGDQSSDITEEHIKHNLDGLTAVDALKSQRLFILDHHDALMPYVRSINLSTSTKIYASRTLLFLKSDGTLKLLVIELSLPHLDEGQLGITRNVYTPAEEGVESSIWQLAKAYVAVADSGVHQLISHWLNTHAVCEPVIIATNRQLSVVHPIYKLLHPHFRDTMKINALARQVLINAGGIIETTFFPEKLSMEISSEIYKNWVFTEQALPADLIKRGVAVEDKNAPNDLRLLIEDYPYAVDGLEIWFAIRNWVEDYCSLYYKTDNIVQNDTELQSWWKELVEEGHGDKKNEPWWPKMQTREELIESCTIIIWTCSALHAAVNFGQYPYGGLIPNRPTTSRRHMPEQGTLDYEELESKPEKAFLKTVTAQFQSLLVMAIIEVLSTHSSDEVYLGMTDTPGIWTSDTAALEAFERFGKKLAEIEVEITNRNNDERLKNRVGTVRMPYTLLFPTGATGETGMAFRGIPNSVSI